MSSINILFQLFFSPVVVVVVVWPFAVLTASPQLLLSHLPQVLDVQPCWGSEGQGGVGGQGHRLPQQTAGQTTKWADVFAQQPRRDGQPGCRDARRCSTNQIYHPPTHPPLCVCPCSLPAALCDAAPSAAADPAEASGGAAEGPLPLSQHEAGQQPGLGLSPPRSRLQQVGSCTARNIPVASLSHCSTWHFLSIVHQRHAWLLALLCVRVYFKPKVWPCTLSWSLLLCTL